MQVNTFPLVHSLTHDYLLGSFMCQALLYVLSYRTAKPRSHCRAVDITTPSLVVAHSYEHLLNLNLMSLRVFLTSSCRVASFFLIVVLRFTIIYLASTWWIRHLDGLFVCFFFLSLSLSFLSFFFVIISNIIRSLYTSFFLHMWE